MENGKTIYFVDDCATEVSAWFVPALNFIFALRSAREVFALSSAFRYLFFLEIGTEDRQPARRRDRIIF